MSTRAEIAEARVTQLLEGAGLPQPDVIEHGETYVRFLWTDRKVAVVVDLTDFEQQIRDEHEPVALRDPGERP